MSNPMRSKVIALYKQVREKTIIVENVSYLENGIRFCG